jgi:hypothetical protein
VADGDTQWQRGEGGIRRQACGDRRGGARPVAARPRWNQAMGGGHMVSTESRRGEPLTSGPECHSPGRRDSI